MERGSVFDLGTAQVRFTPDGRVSVLDAIRMVAIVAYYRTGGVAALKKQVEALTAAGESMVSKATDSLRDKTADALDKAEETVRGAEEKKEPPKPKRKKET